MNHISFVARTLSEEELHTIWEGFKENEIRHTQVHQTSERIGYVVLDDNKVIGCSTGLAYKNGKEYTGWFNLTDLFVDKEHRGKGIGRKVLLMLEEKLKSLGINKIRVWTAGFEAPDFYKKFGYIQFAELENYYRTGHSRIALRKNL